jgi:flagellar hook-length control protein FliK
MINLVPTLAGPAASPTGKPPSGRDPAADVIQAAAGAASAKTNTDAASPNTDGSFQSLLDARTGKSHSLISDSVAPELPSQLPADGLLQSGQTSHGLKQTDKPVTVAPIAATPGTDMASLIGVAAAAGQAAVQRGIEMTGAPNTAQATPGGTASDQTAEGLAATSEARVTAGATALTTGDASGQRLAPETRAAAGAATFADKASDASNAAALTNAQKNLRDAEPVAAHVPAANDIASVSSQGVAMPAVAVPAGNAASAPSAPAVSASIATPVGAQGWDQSLGQHVVWMVAQRNPTAEIHVNPPELGPLSVTVNVTNNTASATFVAAHAATRDAIADAMPRLKDMLAESGIALGQVMVSAESFSQGGGSGSGQPGTGAHNAGAGATGNLTPVAASGLVSPVKTGRAAQGLVDTFA